MKIIAIVGARPQFIKHAPIELFFKDKCSFLTIHTGQHYDENMSKVFFEEL
jgi:UDP-GlcNAc3NAcA epimerase